MKKTVLAFMYIPTLTFPLQVDVYSEKKGLVIVGYYHANQRLEDNRYYITKA